jgi:hypothetical protein
MSTQISTATNITAPDLSNPTSDPNKFYNNYYSGDLSVGPANDAIVAYFQKYTGDSESGKNLAGAVIFTAKASGIDPMAVLSEFQKYTPGEINNYLVSFLNFNRVPTSLLGIKHDVKANQIVARSIIP